MSWSQYIRLLAAPGRKLAAIQGQLQDLLTPGTRGLVASGSGNTDFEALYEMLGGLYVVPLSDSLPMRLAAFLRLTLLRGVSIRKAKQLFQKDHPNEREAQVMALSRQALLSTAELGVKDISTDEKLMDAIYDDDYTSSDNIADMMLTVKSRESVTVAIANLYFRKQIIFERV